MKDKLTKAELIVLLASSSTLKRSEIHLLIDELFEVIKSSLLLGKVIELRGFGTFEIKQRKGREHARNPKTGKMVHVEDHGVVIFRAGKELKLLAREKTTVEILHQDGQ